MRFPARFLFPAFLFTAASALACSVPVFRYALEHWPADPFHVLVFHRGPLSGEQQAALREAEKKEGARANVLVRTVDLDGEAPEDLRRLFESQKDARAPWMVARFPSSSGIREPVVSQALTPESLAALLDSPARAETARRLASGESAVWLLLESGDKAADDAAEKLLQERLEYLASVMTLPKLDESDIANGLVSVAEEDLRLDFSLLRVSRADAAETALVRMLLLSEEGLDGLDEPMVFPVFGRGRALYALAGAGIRQEMIESAAAFLVGKCSCQVKEQNPGVDLLMTADWDAAAKASPLLERELPTLAELVKPESSTIAAAAQENRPAWTAWALGAAVLVLAAAGLRLLRR